MYIVKTLHGACLKLEMGDISVSVACESEASENYFTECDLRLFDINTRKEVTEKILGEKAQPINSTARLLEIIDIVREIEEEK